MAAAYPQKSRPIINDPGFLRFLLNDNRAAAFWLPIRLWLGWQWIQTADTKISNPEWMENGEALKLLWERIVITPESGNPSAVYGWYQNIIQMLLNAGAYTWLARLLVYGELLIGIVLILGVFTGIAAFGGGFMSWNAMMAGTVSANPIFFVVAIGLMLGWKVAGNIGVDYFLLSWLGTPWGRQRIKPEEVQALYSINEDK